MSVSETFEYIVVGGGLSGCVLASRLSQAGHSVALLEAGTDARENPQVQQPLAAPSLEGGELFWNDRTVPQRGLGGRTINHGGGKQLSGGSAVNYGIWTRGHDVDFDELAEGAGCGRWSYQQLLPYFLRSERHFGADLGNNTHGYGGNFHTMPAAEHKLRPIFKQAFEEADIPSVADANIGNPLGVTIATWNWRDNLRQPAASAFDLSKAKVFLNAKTQCILFDASGATPRATGVKLVDGIELKVTKEVIASCGSLRTPQLLMLSGIGDQNQLKKHGIPTVLDQPAVGSNFHDHMSIRMMYKLRDNTKGFALGDPSFVLEKSGAGEYIYTGTVPNKELIPALQRDGVDAENHKHVTKPRGHYEMTIMYAPAGVSLSEPPPMNGSIITAAFGVFLPTSRGSIQLRSADPLDAPLIDPNYMGTEHDRCVMRESTRQTMRIFDTPAAKREIEGTFGANGIGLHSSDAELDDFIRKTAITWFHPAGTAAMGTVVDNECKVQGVEGLRVVDASILPDPICAHYQSPMYAMSNYAADIILGLV